MEVHTTSVFVGVGVLVLVGGVPVTVNVGVLHGLAKAKLSIYIRKSPAATPPACTLKAHISEVFMPVKLDNGIEIFCHVVVRVPTLT
jgi:hypothetical protein